MKGLSNFFYRHFVVRVRAISLDFALFMLALGLAHSATAHPKNIAIDLDAPEVSLDGAFIIRVELNKKSLDTTKHTIQLWRSFEDGQFSLVTSQPSFSEIAQYMHTPGDYTYFAKIVSDKNEEIAVSDRTVVQVKLRYPQLVTLGAF